MRWAKSPLEIAIAIVLAYSAWKIEDLGARVKKIQQQVSDLESDVGSLESKLDGMNFQLQETKDQTDAIYSEVTDIRCR